MSKTLRLEILSPERKVYGGEVRMVITRATTGEMGVLPGHAPLVALLEPRPIRVLTEEGEQQIIVPGGVMQVKPDLVTIVTNG